MAADRRVEYGPPPTPNRKKWPYQGTCEFQGLRILVENLPGSYREGKGPDGKPWRVKMQAGYGEFAETLGNDGDPVDVFVGPDPDAPVAYVVHQKFPGTEVYDEDKVVLGCRTLAEARRLYLAHYDQPGFFGGVTPWPVAELRAFLRKHPEVERLDSPSRVRDLVKADDQLVLLPSKVNPLVRRWQRPMYDPTHGRVRLDRGLMVFASGSNRTSDIEALADIGHPIGVAAPEVMGRPAEEQLARLQGRMVDVFVDSGAFSEVDGTPIGDKQWQAILGLYGRLARRLGAWVHVVAPDRVGDQATTLQRLNVYRDPLVDAARDDAEVLVPLQRGADDLPTFWHRARTALDFPPDLEWRLVPAIPLKKQANSPADVVRFVEQVQPRRIHLLGKGVEAHDAQELLDALKRAHPDVEISMDSNRLAALSGHTGGAGGGPRPLTKLKIQAKKLGATGWQSQRWGVPLAVAPDMQDRLADIEGRLAAVENGGAPGEAERLTRQRLLLRRQIGPLVKAQHAYMLRPGEQVELLPVSDTGFHKIAHRPGYVLQPSVKDPRILRWQRVADHRVIHGDFDERPFDLSDLDMPLETTREVLRHRFRSWATGHSEPGFVDSMLYRGFVFDSVWPRYEVLPDEKQAIVDRLVTYRRDMAARIGDDAQWEVNTLSAAIPGAIAKLLRGDKMTGDAESLGDIAKTTWRGTAEATRTATREKLDPMVGTLAAMSPVKLLSTLRKLGRRVEAYPQMHRVLENHKGDQPALLALLDEARKMVMLRYAVEPDFQANAEEETHLGRSVTSPGYDNRVWRDLERLRREAESLQVEGEEIGHWGSADRTNELAALTAMVSASEYRPLPDMQPMPQTVRLHVLQRGIARRKLAQQSIKRASRETYPTLYRGMTLPGKYIGWLESGAATEIPLTGCTAFAFDRSLAHHYATSAWTSAKSPEGSDQAVIVEVTRDDECDDLISGWHRNKSPDTVYGPAYEVLSGAERLVIEGVRRPRNAGDPVVLQGRLRRYTRHERPGRSDNADEEQGAGGARARARAGVQPRAGRQPDPDAAAGGQLSLLAKAVFLLRRALKGA